MLCNTDGINYVIAFFHLSVRSNFFQLIVADTPASPPLHLRIKHLGIDVAHKKYYFQRSNISAGSYKRYSNGYSEIFFNTEIPYEGIRITRRVSYFPHIIFRNLAVIESFPKYLSCNLYNLIGMIVVFCED